MVFLWFSHDFPMILVLLRQKNPIDSKNRLLLQVLDRNRRRRGLPHSPLQAVAGQAWHRDILGHPGSWWEHTEKKKKTASQGGKILGLELKFIGNSMKFNMMELLGPTWWNDYPN